MKKTEVFNQLSPGKIDVWLVKMVGGREGPFHMNASKI
jgi:hypothetical protein